MKGIDYDLILKHFNWSQADLAKDLGKGNKTAYNYIHGHTDPKGKTMLRLLDLQEIALNANKGFTKEDIVQSVTDKIMPEINKIKENLGALWDAIDDYQETKMKAMEEKNNSESNKRVG